MPIASFPTVLLQTAAVAVGNGVALNVEGQDAIVVQVVGITTATITWEANVDLTTWVGVALADLTSTTRARSLTTAANGLFLLEFAPGLKQFRARISAWTSGTITVYASAE